jgi:hypothetical protein
MNLTVITATRNDSYNGDSMGRLKASLARTFANATAAGVEWDAIICDWGSVAPVSEVTNFGPRVQHIHVSPEAAGSYGTPFYETKACNLAARAATGEWILRVDQDTIVGRRLFDWFAAGGLQPRDAFYSCRRDLPPGQTVEDDAAPYNSDPRARTFLCAGGALLMSRALWHEVKGYSEAMRWFNHIEQEFLNRLLRKGYNVYLIGEKLDVPFYHIHHERTDCDARPHNTSQVIVPSFTLPENGDDWGTITEEKP